MPKLCTYAYRRHCALWTELFSTTVAELQRQKEPSLLLRKSQMALSLQSGFRVIERTLK
jgi:hypothetical protein